AVLWRREPLVGDPCGQPEPAGSPPATARSSVVGPEPAGGQSMTQPLSVKATNEAILAIYEAAGRRKLPQAVAQARTVLDAWHAPTGFWRPLLRWLRLRGRLATLAEDRAHWQTQITEAARLTGQALACIEQGRGDPRQTDHLQEA